MSNLVSKIINAKRNPKFPARLANHIGKAYTFSTIALIFFTNLSFISGDIIANVHSLLVYILLLLAVCSNLYLTNREIGCIDDVVAADTLAKNIYFHDNEDEEDSSVVVLRSVTKAEFDDDRRYYYYRNRNRCSEFIGAEEVFIVDDDGERNTKSIVVSGEKEGEVFLVDEMNNGGANRKLDRNNSLFNNDRKIIYSYNNQRNISNVDYDSRLSGDSCINNRNNFFPDASSNVLSNSGTFNNTPSVKLTPLAYNNDNSIEEKIGFCATTELIAAKNIEKKYNIPARNSSIKKNSTDSYYYDGMISATTTSAGRNNNNNNYYDDGTIINLSTTTTNSTRKNNNNNNNYYDDGTIINSSTTTKTSTRKNNNNNNYCYDDGTIINLSTTTNSTRNNNNNNYCDICLLEMSARRHHCPLCGVCIDACDHHCFFTNCCIGIRNQRYFVGFLYWVSVSCLLSSIHIHQYINQTYPSLFIDSSLFYKAFNLFPLVTVLKTLLGYSTPAFFYHYYVGLVSLSSCNAAVIFLLIQLFLIYKGRTMREYKSDREGLSFGCCGNYRTCLGNYWGFIFIFPVPLGFFNFRRVGRVFKRFFFLKIRKGLLRQLLGIFQRRNR